MLWHIKKALKKKLSDNTYPKLQLIAPMMLMKTFDFIDIEFYPLISSKKEKNFVFCPKDLRPKIIELLGNHLHCHPFLFQIVLENFYQKKIYGDYPFRKFMNFVLSIIYDIIDMCEPIFGPTGIKEKCGFYGVVLLLKMKFVFFAQQC
jgi:hypothetical protein